MNCGLLRAVLVAGLVWGGWVHAQDTLAQDTLAQDTLLQSYTLASESLDEAAAALPDDPSLSQDALVRAESALRPLSRDTTSPQLVTALEGVFERAETAIQNRSPTDLSVQAAVLKGGLQRLLYESALQDASAGALDEARGSLAAIAQDLGAEAPQGETAQRLFASFDLGAAQVAQRRLSSAQAQRENAKGAAYLDLANAYGAFFSIQDSPRLSLSLSPSFAQAFQALVNEDGAAFDEALGQLQGQLGSFAAAAQSALEEGAPLPANPAPSNTLLETPTETPTEALAAPPLLEPEAALPAASTVPGDSAAPATDEAATAATPGTTAGDPLTSELGGFGLTGAVRDQLAAQYRSLGLTSLDAALAQLYAASGAAIAALQNGDQRTAKARLEDFRTRYERLLAPLVNSQEAGADLSALLERLSASPDLRQQDVAVLVGEVEGLERLLTNTPRAAVQELMLASQPFWSGWLRLGVVLVLGILAFIPLRLLNLAFGDANRNWRLVGIALFLLLLPVIYEGLSALFSIVADLTGQDALNVLSPFSIFQNTLSQLIWAVLTGLAILLASAGLYGICVQFGLLGKGSGKETIVGTEANARRRSGNASVEWDEEF